MNLVKKTLQILALVFLTASLTSCKEQCYTSEEFDVNYVTIDSYPTNDGIDGLEYDPVTGGQVAKWHDTGLKSNGDLFLIRISGSWTAWNAGIYDDMSESELTQLPICRTCAKIDSSTPNCICYAGETIASEENQSCSPNTMQYDASGNPTVEQQDNPNLCSCTKNPIYGQATDYGVFHSTLNYHNKDGSTKIADQQEPCRYIAGMGAYIGLFGHNGVTDPTRLYHLYAEGKDQSGNATTVCDISLDANGQCIDDSGKDRTSYVFTSANDRIFLKDDGEGNSGKNLDTSNDTYHGPNEVVKLKIYDSYYNDNYGSYNIAILRGVGTNLDLSEVGLLEFLVRLVENTLLGDLEPINTVTQNADGENVTTTTYERVGGIIEFMYRAIVQDSGFITILQVTLSLYIAFYGIAVLLGIAEVSKKELMSRLLKIALIIFFTSAASWSFYNKIVVGFFYDSMNYLVSLMMSLSDSALSQGMDTTAIIVAQMERASDLSSSTRFSYIDTTIEMMMSQAFAAKVFSLFLSHYFGIIFIILIYGLVAGFIYVMLVAASMYVVNVMKIIFALCLGPIFMIFTLFNQTSSIFKNWLAFLGARSLEIVLIFAILYNFVMLIDLSFKDLLDYSACVENFSIGGLFSIKILRAHGIDDRTLAVWFGTITKIAALIFITYLILNKVAEVAGHLITIGGVANKDASGVGHGQSGMKLAGAGGGSSEKLFGNKGTAFGGIAGDLLSLGKSAALGAFQLGKAGAIYGGKGAAMASRATGASGMMSAIGNYSPLAPIRRAARGLALNAPFGMGIINSAHKAALENKGKYESEAKAKGLQGREADAFVQNKIDADTRAKTFAAVRAFEAKRGLTASALGISSDEKIMAALDKQLIHKPVQDYIKEHAKELKASNAHASPDQVLLGKALQDRLVADAKEHFKGNASALKYIDNAVAGKGSTREEKIAGKNLQSAVSKNAELKPAQAARLFAGKPELQNKYIQHLQDQEFKRHSKNEEAHNKPWNIPGAYQWTKNIASRGVDGLARVTGTNLESRNPKTAQDTFQRNLKNKERSGDLLNKALLNPFNRSNTLDKATSLASYMTKKATGIDYKTLNQRSDEAQRIAARRSLEDQTDDAKRAFLQNRLQELAVKDLAKEVGKINKLERKGKMSEAKIKKEELLKKAQDDLLTRDANGLPTFKNDPKSNTTLFEKAARLSYLHKQLKLGGEDPKLTISKEINKAIAAGAKDIKDKMAAGNIADSNQKTQDIKALRSGLLSGKMEGPEFDKIAAKVQEQIINPGSDALAKQSFADADSIGNVAAGTLSNAVRGDGLVTEDRKTKDEENAKINEDAKDNKKQLEQLDKDIMAAALNQMAETNSMLAKETARQKEAAEKEAADKERQAKELAEANYKKERSEALGTLINAQMEVFKLNKELKGETDSDRQQDLNNKISDTRNFIQLKIAEDLAIRAEHKREEHQAKIDEVEKKGAAFNFHSDAPEAPAEAKALSQEVTALTNEISTQAVVKDSPIPGLLAPDLGLKASDLGLHASNILLGVPDATNKFDDEARLKALGMQQNQINAMLKLNKLNLALKEFELKKLDLTKDENARLAKDLQSEIDNLKEDVKHMEREESQIENAKTDLNKS